MHLLLEQLGCKTLELVSEGDTDLRLRFLEIDQGSGRMEFGEGLTVLDNLSIRQLLAQLEVRTETSTFSMPAPARLSHVSFDGRIRNGFVGELRTSLLESEALALTLGAQTISAKLVAEGMGLKMDDRGGHVDVGTLTLKDLEVCGEGWTLRTSVLSLSGFRVAWDSGRPKLFARKAHARGLEFLRGESIVKLDVVELPSGLSFDGSLTLDKALIGALELSLKRATKKQGEDEDAQVKESSISESEGLPSPKSVSLSPLVFDTVSGKLSADVQLSVSLPVVGRRDSEHNFRIDVVGGVINYREFESGLSALEDAFVDIRLRGNRLQLERDIPLIPGFRKPILFFELSEGDVDLAEKELVRLRTLPTFQLAQDDKDDEDDAPEKKKSVRLHKVVADGIAVDLSLDETEVVRDAHGGFVRGHIDRFSVSGRLAGKQEGADGAEEVSAGGLKGQAKGLGLVASEFRIADAILSGNLVVGAVEEAVVAFDGFAPTSMKLSVRKVELTHLAYTPTAE